MKFESPQTPKKEEKTFRHDLIQKEFRTLLENSTYEVPEDTEAVMILSASPRGWHTEANQDEDFPEDVRHIEFGVEVYKQMAARKLGKPISELTEMDLKNAALPYFILNGATEQQVMMERITSTLGFPKEKTIFLNCGDHDVANTKTQFTKLAEHPVVGALKHFAVISSRYHMPRVARTASANLPEDVDFDVLSVPLKDFPFDVYRKVRREVKRIMEYKEKGDISEYPRENK